MTNIDRAAKLMADVFRPLTKGHSDALGLDLATLLHDANLLVSEKEKGTKYATEEAIEALANYRYDKSSMSGRSVIELYERLSRDELEHLDRALGGKNE